MQVGTTINLCDQRPADSRAAKWRWNAAPKLKLVEKKAQLSGLARNVGDPPAEVAYYYYYYYYY